MKWLHIIKWISVAAMGVGAWNTFVYLDDDKTTPERIRELYRAMWIFISGAVVFCGLEIRNFFAKRRDL
jgi:hypothetical protein